LKRDIKRRAKTEGNLLGRWAIHHDFSVIRIHRATGATRQTIYNWFRGDEVSPAYRDKVTELVKILQAADSAETAWGQACKMFKIKG
jgi:hypothetical protein